MLKHLIVLTTATLFTFALPGKAQDMTSSTDTIPKESIILDGQQLNEKQLKRHYKQLRKDSIRAHKKNLVVCPGRSLLYTGSIPRRWRSRTCQLQDE